MTWITLSPKLPWHKRFSSALIQNQNRLVYRLYAVRSSIRSLRDMHLLVLLAQQIQGKLTFKRTCSSMRAFIKRLSMQSWRIIQQLHISKQRLHYNWEIRVWQQHWTYLLCSKQLRLSQWVVRQLLKNLIPQLIQRAQQLPWRAYAGQGFTRSWKSHTGALCKLCQANLIR